MPQGVSRRRLLEALGTVGLAAVAGLYGKGALAVTAAETGLSPAGDAQDDTGRHQWVFLIDLRRCDGCEKCTKACQEMHHLPEDTRWIRVYELESASGQTYFMPRLCMQCENAPCIQVCPVGASYKSPDGITLIDQDRCIGCRMCMAACPYEARYFNWGDPPEVPAGLAPSRPEWPVPQQKGTVGKCVMCVHDLRYGKLPACVRACSMEALYAGDLNVDLATNGREVVKLSEFMKASDAIRYKEELGTRPRVYYIPGHGQDLEY